MGFKVIWFYIIILLFIYYPFIIWVFLCLGLGVFCNPFVRRLLGFSIIIGNFLLCFWEFPIFVLELDFDLGWGYIIYLVG